MRRLKRWLLPLFTLLLVAAGAAMPFVTAYMQDLRQTKAEVRPFDSFSLTLRQEADLGRTLRTIRSSEYYIHSAYKAENAMLTEGLALEAAESALDKLVQYGLLDKALRAEFYEPGVQAEAVVSVAGEIRGEDAVPLPGPENAAGLPDANAETDVYGGELPEEEVIPTWTVYWRRPENIYIWLDDASGKAFLISLPLYMESDSIKEEPEALYARAENWRAFLEDYYGVEVYISDEEWFDDAVRFDLSFSLGSGEGQELCSLALYIYPSLNFMTLNPYPQ